MMIVGPESYQAIGTLVLLVEVDISCTTTKLEEGGVVYCSPINMLHLSVSPCSRINWAIPKKCIKKEADSKKSRPLGDGGKNSFTQLFRRSPAR